MRILSLVVFAAISIFVNIPMTQASSTFKVTLLHINDAYEIDAVDNGANGGLARVKSIVDEIKANDPNTLFFHAGDFLFTSVESKMFEGRQMIDIMNRLGFDGVTIGNHEFDKGSEKLLERMRESKYQYLLANVIDKRTGLIFGGAIPRKIYELPNGLKVGVFALSTADTVKISNPGPNVEFQNIIPVASEQVKALRAAGADVVVALTHLGLAEDRAVMRLVSGIDVILGGHEHYIIQEEMNHTVLLKAGHNACHVGRVDIEVKKSSGAKTEVTAVSHVIPVEAAQTEDAEIANIVNAYESEVKKKMDQPLGILPQAWDTRRTALNVSESVVTNFITDRFREAAKVDVAFINSASIRTESVLPAGPFTLRMLEAMFPFDDPMLKVSVSGKTLWNVIEHSLEVIGPGNNRLLHPSGMRYVYDSRKPVGQRLVSVDVAGTPIDLDKKYSLLVDTFHFDGGDDFKFNDSEPLQRREDALNKVLFFMDLLQGQAMESQLDGRVSDLAVCSEALSKK